MDHTLLYKCRNCGAEKPLPVMSRYETPHAALKYSAGNTDYLFTTHRCSPTRVGLADLIAIEEHA